MRWGEGLNVDALGFGRNFAADHVIFFRSPKQFWAADRKKATHRRHTDGQFCPEALRPNSAHDNLVSNSLVTGPMMEAATSQALHATHSRHRRHQARSTRRGCALKRSLECWRIEFYNPGCAPGVDAVAEEPRQYNRVAGVVERQL